MSTFEPPDGVQKISSGQLHTVTSRYPRRPISREFVRDSEESGTAGGGFGVRKFKNQGFGQRGIPDDAFRHSGGGLYIMMRSFASSLPPGD